MPTPGQELSTIDFESLIGGPLIAVVNAQAQAALSTVNFIKQVGFKPAGDNQDPQASGVNDPVYVSFQFPKEVSPYQPAVGSGDGTISVSLVSGGSGYAAPVVAITGGGGAGATATAQVANGVITGLTLTNAGQNYTSNPTVTITDPTPGAGGAVASAVANTAAVPAQIQQMKLEVPLLTMLPIPFLRIDDVNLDFNAKITSTEYRKVDTSFKLDSTLEAKAGWFFGSVKLKVSAAYQRTTQAGSNVERTYSMAVHVHAEQDEIPAGSERVLSILEDAIRAQPLGAPAPVIS